MLVAIIIMLALSGCSKQAVDSLSPTSFNNVYKINYNGKNILNSSDVVVAVDKIPSTFNPFLARTFSERTFVNATASSLVRRSVDGKNYELDLADDYRVLDEGRKLYFRLKQNVFFVGQQGQKLDELTTADVVSTVNLLQKYLKGTSLYKRLFLKNRIMLVETINRYEFYILIDKPNPNFFDGLSRLPIVRAEYCRKFLNFKDFILDSDEDNIFAGTGPYFCKKITKNEVILSKNKHYYGDNSDNLAEIVLKSFNEQHSPVEMIKKSVGDIIECRNLNDLREVYAYLNTHDTHYKIIDNDFGAVYNLLTFNLDNPAFKNPDFRRMFREAVYDKMTQVSHARRGLNPTTNYKEESRSDLSDYVMSLTLISSADVYDDSLATKVKNVLTGLGVSCNLEILPYYKFVATLKKGTFDLALVEADFDGSFYNIYECLDWLDLNPDSLIVGDIFDSMEWNVSAKQIDSFCKIIDENVLFAAVFNNRQYYFVSDKIETFNNQSGCQYLSTSFFE